MDKEFEYLMGWLSDEENRDPIQVPHIANDEMIGGRLMPSEILGKTWKISC